MLVLASCFLVTKLGSSLMTRDLLNPPPWMEFGWGKFMMMMIIIILKHCFSAFQIPSLWHFFGSWSVSTIFCHFFSTKNLGNFWKEHVFLVKSERNCFLIFGANFFQIFNITKLGLFKKKTHTHTHTHTCSGCVGNCHK